MTDNQKMVDVLKTTSGLNLDVDVAADLAYKKNYVANSFFATGRFTSKGHVLTYLLHTMALTMPGPFGGKLTFCFSVTDETEKKYVQFSKAYSLSKIEVAQDRFLIKTPAGTMEGDLEKLHFDANIDRASLDLELVPVNYPIYNGGTGRFQMSNIKIPGMDVFDLPGMEMYQYSLPTVISNGTIVLDGESYPIEDGITWYDRQWGGDFSAMKSMAKNLLSMPKLDMNALVWGWVDLNIEQSEDKISVWLFKEGSGASWATLVEPDGTNRVVDVELKTSDYWQSPDSGKGYPMTLQIKIPTLDAELTVRSVMENQELFFSKNENALNHYEGASTFTGCYRGQPAAGYCCLELLGNWG